MTSLRCRRKMSLTNTRSESSGGRYVNVIRRLGHWLHTLQRFDWSSDACKQLSFIWTFFLNLLFTNPAGSSPRAHLHLDMPRHLRMLITSCSQGCQPSVNLRTVRKNLTQNSFSVKVRENTRYTSAKQYVMPCESGRRSRDHRPTVEQRFLDVSSN